MDVNNLKQKVLAARELLATTKRNLQLVDEHITLLQDGRIAIEPAGDVSSEHRIAFFGAVDDTDQQNGVAFGRISDPLTQGFGNPKTGTIRIQEDAAFVCTNIFVASANFVAGGGFDENESGGDNPFFNPYLRLTDGNTGRVITTGMTVGPTDLDRGVIPFTYISSIRAGLGSNVKNKLFSEFTIPRAGTVKVEVFNVAEFRNSLTASPRAFITLFGFKVFGA